MKRLIFAAAVILLICGLFSAQPAFAQEAKWYRGHDHIGAFVGTDWPPQRVVIIPAVASERSPVFRIVSGVVDTGDGKQVFFLFPDEPRFRSPREISLPFTTSGISVELRGGYEFLRIQTGATADEAEHLMNELGWATGRAVGSGSCW